MTHDENPVRTLLCQLIDYAGLFPPAGLDMDSAVRNYAAYFAGEHSWMLGRFIVPFDRLEEFERAARPYFTDREWRVSLLGASAKTLLRGRGYVVDAIEQKAERMERIGPGSAIPTYYEVATSDPDAPMEGVIEAIARIGARAKIRTGGLTAGAFPAASRIARFLRLCHQAGVLFKATAGLHHPIRGVYPFTYESDSACGELCGFLNVFLAAAMTFNGATESETTLMLEEKSTKAFRIADQSIGWHSYLFTAAEIRDLRERFAIGFGSCSFEEPVSDLKALGFL